MHLIHEIQNIQDIHLIGASVPVPAPSSTQRIAASAPEWWLKFDDASGTTANDSGSGNHDGTYSTWAGPALPLLGQSSLSADDPTRTCAKLVRSQQNYVTTPNFRTSLGTYTLGITIKAVSLPAGSRLLSQRGSLGTWFDIYVDGSGYLLIYDGASVLTISNTVALTTGTVYVLFITVNEPTLTVYINGVAQTPVNINSSASGEPLLVGALDILPGAGTEFDGWVQDACLWNRVLDLATEITPITEGKL